MNTDGILERDFGRSGGFVGEAQSDRYRLVRARRRVLCGVEAITSCYLQPYIFGSFILLGSVISPASSYESTNSQRSLPQINDGYNRSHI